MRIVFFGTPEFAVETASAIYASTRHTVVGVVTAPDRPAGRGLKLRCSPVKEWALSQNLPLEQPDSLRSEAFLARLDEWKGDCFVVVAFRMLPKVVWSRPSHGTFNVHASLLPDFRGAAPIHWAIYRGVSKTGVTTFLLDDKIDTGALLLQTETAISQDETTGELYERLQKMGAKLALMTLDGLEDQKIIPAPQTREPLYDAPKITREHQFIPAKANALEQYRAFRSMTPFPGSLCRILIDEVVEFKIVKCNYLNSYNKDVNGHCIASDRWFVAGPNGALELLELQWPGKRAMSVKDFLRGTHLKGYYEIV
jgi:methionyl-tRNA formyltransferase